MPRRALGRRPPSNKPALKLADVLTGVVPEHPISADHLSGITFGLDGNDRFGVCGPTSCDNYCRLVSAALVGQPVPWTQNQVFDLYRRSGNPNFNPETGEDDNGVIMQDMLNQWLHGGAGIDENGQPITPVAFAKVDVDNDDELEAAVSIFGGILWGVTLYIAQDKQTDQGLWDYVPRSGMWGGHAIVDGSFKTDRQDVITWAMRVQTTDAFRRHQLDEAWVVVLPWHLQHPGFQEGVDVERLAAAYKSLTGRDLPLPEPAPAPTPTPEPDPVTPTPVSPGGDEPVPAGCFLVGPLSPKRQAALARHAKSAGFASVTGYLSYRLEHGSY